MEYADIAFRSWPSCCWWRSRAFWSPRRSPSPGSPSHARRSWSRKVSGGGGPAGDRGDRPRYVNVLLFLRLVCTTSAIAIATLIGIEGDRRPRWWQMGLAVAVMVFVGYVVTGRAADPGPAARRADRPGRLRTRPVPGRAVGPVDLPADPAGQRDHTWKGYRQARS